MAINTTTLNAGTGGDKVLHDTLSTVNGSAAPSGAVAQVVKQAFGAPDAATLVDASNPLPVQVRGALNRTTLLNAVSSTGAGGAVADSGNTPSFSGSVTGTGAVSATVVIECRNTASGSWVPYGTLLMSGTTTASDALAGSARYMEYRANCTAIGGTGATLTVTMAS